MASESEKVPLGLQIPPVAPGVEIPPEPPDVGGRSLAVAARLMAGATIFFFLAFVFAYFYLRALNAGHMWKPAHVKPNQGLGAAFVACIVLSGAAALFAGRRMKSGSAWLPAAAVSLVLGLAAIAVQCIHYTVQKFGPTDGAYASVFCIWTAMYLVAVLATMYWLETQAATELRARRSPAPRAAGDIADPDRLIAPALDAAVFYWVFLACVGVLTYVVLYLL